MVTSAFAKHSTDRGIFWSSRKALTPAALRTHLKSFDRSTLKRAAEVGGDQEGEFEQAFSSLAYSYLKDKAPRLLDHLVGFQLVDRNEDNTKAIAIFGFQIGKQWLYAPVFFLNGDLKGHELLYVKNEDMFVPMKENWVNYLIAKKPHQLGEGSPQTTFELGGMMPDLSRLAYPPTSSKFGADFCSKAANDGRQPMRPRLDSWAEPCLPLMAAAALKVAAALYGKAAPAGVKLAFDRIVERPLTAVFAPVAAQFDLRSFPWTLGSLKTAMAAYRAYPLIKQGFDRFYGGLGFFREMGERVKAEGASLAKEASLITRESLKRKGKPKIQEYSSTLIPVKKAEHPIKTGELQVIALDVSMDHPITQNLPDLTEEERQKLLRDTVLIKDKRDPHGVSEVYNTQTRVELTNPSETDLYEVLEKPGRFDRMLVVSSPQTGRGRQNFATLVRLSDPRAWLNTHPTNLWTRREESREDYKKWWKTLPAERNLKKDGTYLVLYEDGAGTAPFRVREDYGDGYYRVSWKDNTRYGHDRPEFLPHIASTSGTFDLGGDYDSYDAQICFTEKDGTSMRSVRSELSLPKNARVLKLVDPPKPRKDHYGEAYPSDSGSEAEPVRPGSLADVQLYLSEKTAAIKLFDSGGEVVLISRNGQERFTKKAALISLVRDHGTSEAVARAMIKEATQKRSASYRIKYAYGFDTNPNLQPGPTAPQFPPPNMGTEQAGPRAWPAMYPQEDLLPVQGMQASLTDPRIYDPFYNMDPKTMYGAQQAAQQGQKDVFDTSMISGLLKTVRQDSLVDRYLPTLVKNLDALGRMLFLFYWHQEDFEDRYGKADLGELEDSLRNNFDGSGDLVLFLREKQVGGDTIGGINGRNAGEPDITESARN